MNSLQFGVAAAKRGCKYKYFFILPVKLFLSSYYFYIASQSHFQL